MLSTAHSLRHCSKCFYLEIFWVTAKSGWKRFCNEPLHFWFLPLLVLLTVMVFFLTKLLPFAQSVINNNAFAWITFERRNTVRFQPGSFSDLKKIRIWTRRWPLAFFAYPADTSGAQRPDKSAFHVFIAVRAFHIHHSPCLACFNPQRISTASLIWGFCYKTRFWYFSTIFCGNPIFFDNLHIYPKKFISINNVDLGAPRIFIVA